MKKSLHAAVVVLLLISFAAVWMRRTPRASSEAVAPSPVSAPSRPTPAPAPVSAPPSSPVVGPTQDIATAPRVNPTRSIRERLDVKRVLYENDSALDESSFTFTRTATVETGRRDPLVRIVEQLQRDPRTGRDDIFASEAMIADHVMVKFRAGLSRATIDEQLRLRGLRVRRTVDDAIALVEFSAASGDSLPEVLARLAQATDLVAIAEPDYIVTTQDLTPNDPVFADGTLWGLHNTGQVGDRDVHGTPDQDIDAPEAWSIANDASSVIVAVIDTGVRLTHEDLAANLWTNPGESGGGKETNGIDDDNNGTIDDVHGINVITKTGDPSDDNGHGTHIAGTIGAVGNNGIGSVGVAWKAQIMAVKFIDARGSGTLSDALTGLAYARQQHAHVINASWGGPGNSALLAEAIEALGNSGTAIACAAGNAALDTTLTPLYPAAYDFPFLISVASMHRLGVISSFSNYGGTQIAAPGEEIYSAWFSSDSAYLKLDGTSMATPHVAGALALLRARYAADTPAQVIDRLISGAKESDVLPHAFADPNVNRPMLFRRVLNLQKPLADPSLPRVARVKVAVTALTHEFGDTFTFTPVVTSETPVTYQWLFNDTPITGATGASLSLVNVVRAQSGKYTLTATNAAGTTYATPIRLSLVGPPAILNQPISLTQVEGNGAVFVVSVLGNGLERVTYQWFRNDTPLVGATFATLLLPQVSTAQAGSYRVTATNPYGSIDSHTVTLSVVPAQTPAITTQPANVSITANQDAVFTVAVTGTPTLTYQWRKDGADLFGEVESTLRIARAQQADAADYSVVVRNSGGSATSAPAHLAVAFATVAPFIVRQPVSREVSVGEGFTLTVAAKGTPAPVFQWRRNGTDIAGATNAGFAIARAKTDDAGNYSVAITNASGTIVSDTAKVTMRAGLATHGWQWRAPLPQGGVLNDATFASGRFVSVGFHGAVITSPDGVTWTPRSSGTPQTLRAITEGGGRLVAVGAAGAIVVSEDGGLSWFVAASPTSVELSRVAYGNGRFIAIGGSPAVVLTSTDARTWTTLAPPNGPLGFGVIFGNGYFCFGGGDGKLRRTADGVNWETIDNGFPLGLGFQMAFGDGTFVAVGSVGLRRTILSSADGVTWVTRVSSSTFGPTAIKRLGGLFVITHVEGYLLTSPDGVTWTEHPRVGSAVAQANLGIAYGAGTYVIVGLGGTVWTSPDAFVWTQRTALSTRQLNTVAYGPAGFVAASAGTSHHSDTGVLWTEHSMQRSSSVFKIIVDQNRYLAIGSDVLSSSTDGVTWTSKTMTGVQPGWLLRSLAYSGGRYVAIGSVVTSLGPPPVYESVIVTSTDGENWTRSTSDDIGDAHDVIHDGSRFVAVGGKTGVLTSTDGIAWTLQHSEGNTVIERIVFDGKRYVAAARNKRALLYSDDLKTWTEATLAPSPTPGQAVGFEDLIFAAGQFIALYNNGTVYSSVDGVTWSESDSGSSVATWGMCYGNHSLVVVGGFGTILQSGPLALSLESITPTPTRQMTARGQTARIDLDTFGIEPLTFQWRKDGTDIPGATGASLEIPGVAASDVGVYSVRMRNGAEEAVSQPAFLAVAEVQPISGEKGTGVIKVTAPAGLEWNLGTLTSWIRFLDTANGRGSGEVRFAFPENLTGAAREVSFVVGGASLTIVQPVSANSAPVPVSRLVNMSTRGRVGLGDETMIAGFVVSGSTPKRVMLRAVGPTLANFGVSGMLPNPILHLYNASGALLRENDDWGRGDASSAFLWMTETSAFYLPILSWDSAVVTTLAPGKYTLHVTGWKAEPTGIALVEVYEAMFADESLDGRRMINLSTRGAVGTGAAVLIAGFVVSDGADRRVLIRGVGPELAKFGLNGVLADPRIDVFANGKTDAIASNDNWNASATNAADVSAAQATTGAFALTAGSADAALITTLKPGVYTVHLSGVGGTSGIGLIEVYELPEP